MSLHLAGLPVRATDYTGRLPRGRDPYQIRQYGRAGLVGVPR